MPVSLVALTSPEAHGTLGNTIDYGMWNVMRVKYKDETKSRKQGIGLSVHAGMLLIVAGSLLAALIPADWAWAGFLIILGISLLIYGLGDRSEGRRTMGVFLASLIFLGIALGCYALSRLLSAL
jgi:hypothetical protein